MDYNMNNKKSNLSSKLFSEAFSRLKKKAPKEGVNLVSIAKKLAAKKFAKKV